jgi:hypothetical protein
MGFWVPFAVLLIFVVSGDLSSKESSGVVFLAVFLFFICWAFSKKDAPPPPPPTMDNVRKELEKILNSKASVEDKKKAGVLLEQLEKMK